MARTRSQRTTTPQTVTVDVIDELVTKLNTLESIEFVRDAWVNKAPDNYGVVEAMGEVTQLWADGHLIDTIWRVRITAYIAGDDDTIGNNVEAKLEALESEGKVDLTHTISRDFDYETGKVRWAWLISLYGGPTREEPAPAGGGT